jgi:hypothetical protein
MSTNDSKPVKAKKLLNPKLLPIAALLLVILALLFMATPLIRASGGLQRNGNIVPQATGQTPPRAITPGGGLGQRFIVGGGGTSPRQVTLGGGLLGGIAGSIFYFVLLLVALVAAVGMFIPRRLGQILGIIMAVIYGLLGLVSLLPLLLAFSFGIRNPVSLILGIFHILLAVAVIVFASIPAKSVSTPVVASPPPAASA